MELSNAQRAEVLIHALPYIQKYYNKIIVVKYGGNAMINEDLKKAVMGDIVLLSLIGIKVVLVHGGGPEISEMLKKIGKQSEFVNGLRVTDAETADIVQMVLGRKDQQDPCKSSAEYGRKSDRPQRSGRTYDRSKTARSCARLCWRNHEYRYKADYRCSGERIYPGNFHSRLRL